MSTNTNYFGDTFDGVAVILDHASCYVSPLSRDERDGSFSADWSQGHGGEVQEIFVRGKKQPLDSMTIRLY